MLTDSAGLRLQWCPCPAGQDIRLNKLYTGSRLIAMIVNVPLYP